MSIKDNNINSFNIRFHKEYKKANFGFFHVAFLTEHDDIVLPMEDKESLEITLDFYHHFILKRKTYPIYEDGKFIQVDVRDKRVIEQILGLPKEAFQKIDIQKDIIAQIHFLDGLSDLKKECYVLRVQNNLKKWYSDDFKLFCLKKGFFFLYDETKPFMKDEATIPVFIDQTRLDNKYLKLYLSATHERFAIDFLGIDDTPSFNEKMKLLDSFSFQERLSYFVNNDEDERFPDVDDDFRKRYTILLKEYFSSIINALYDDYCLLCLNKITEKLSFLSVSSAHDKREVYSISSYFADMYSLDNNNFAFALEDKIRIEKLIEKKLSYHQENDILTFYASLGLPFEGYSFVKDITSITKDKIINHLKFVSISQGEIYLSSKRYDRFYSYLSGEERHRIAFDRRLLIDEGVFYKGYNYLERDDDRLISIMNLNDNSSLACYKKGYTFKEILSSYTFFKDEAIDYSFNENIEKLDRISHNEALYHFYHLFTGISFSNAVSLLLMKYDLQSLSSAKLNDFLWYCLYYPFLEVEQKYRFMMIEKKDTLPLVVLDGIEKEYSSYEPNLAYPYVSYGKLAYSFKKDYFSSPVFCSCQKDALYKRYQYYLSLANILYPKELTKEKNEYIIEHMYLPEDILENIKDGEELFSQFIFKDHVCHLCNHGQPSYHEMLDKNGEVRHNVFLSYIRSKANQFGLFSDPISFDHQVENIFYMLEHNQYKTVMNFDRKYIDPILLPYINISKKTIVSLLCYCFIDEVTYDDFYNNLITFCSLGDKLIYDLLFDCKPNEYFYIVQNFSIFSRLAYIYKMLEISYSLYVSQDIVSDNENEFCMNIDYNPSLPHPYVLLGNYIDCYCDSLSSNHYYICECERESLLKFGKKYCQIYDEKNMDKEIKTPLILGLLGLPYQVILKYQDFDLENNSIESLIDKMEFGQCICRRCTSIPHSSHDEFCRRSFPFRESLYAEYNFAKNKMMHDGFKVVSDKPIYEIHYNSEYHYELNAYVDSNIPFFEFATQNTPEALFTYFVMPKEKLKNILDDFSLLNQNKIEINAYAASVILDSYYKDDNIILDFIMDFNYTKRLKDRIYLYFSEIERVRDGFKDEVCQQILGFITYLFEQFFLKYALAESHIGR